MQYEYLTQPQMAYKYVSLPSPVGLQLSGSGGGGVVGGAGKYEQPSTPGYKYLAASPTYKYVQPPAVTTEPEAAEVPTNSLKYALKYEQNSFKQEQQQLLRQQQQQLEQDYEQPAVQYKYVAVPSYKYVQQVPASYDYTDDGGKQHYQWVPIQSIHQLS